MGTAASRRPRKDCQGSRDLAPIAMVSKSANGHTAIPASLFPPANPSPGRQHSHTPAAEPTLAAAARDAAYDAKAKADEITDLAHTLYGAGLVTRKQLAHAVRKREQAQAEGDKYATWTQKLQKELRKTLAAVDALMLATSWEVEPDDD